jgi:hypothetical protein
LVLIPENRSTTLSLSSQRSSPLTSPLSLLNELARKVGYIIHTGDFGFYDETSIERIAEK